MIEKKIGSRRTLAVEFELELPNGSTRTQDLWGYLWLWADGHCIGQTWEKEIVEFGLKALSEAAADPDSRKSDVLSSMPASEALDLVMWARYGDDEPPMKALVETRESLERFEILPRRTGSFFDYWEAILIEEGAEERFIFRRTSQETFQVAWETGLFKDTINRAYKAFAAVGK